MTNLAWKLRHLLRWNRARKQVAPFTTITFVINIIQDLDILDIDSGSEPSQHGDDPGYPGFTSLVRIPGREVSLSHQHFEVKLVIRKAMDLVVGRLLFENGFPSLATRAIWNRRSLLNACSSIELSTGSHANGRYHQLSQRLKTDAEYVKELSKLVSIYVSE